LTGQRKERGSPGRIQDIFPAFGGLDRIARPVDGQMGNGAQRREMLDRLMCGAVLAEADRVMGHDEGGSYLHHGREADGGTAIIRETQKRATVGD